MIFGALLLSVFVIVLGSCSNPVTPGTFYSNDVFRILASSAYSGEFVTESADTPESGSSNMDISLTATSGQQYTLTVYKSANDGTSLSVELIANETVDGSAISVVVQSSTTTDPAVPATVTLID